MNIKLHIFRKHNLNKTLDVGLCKKIIHTVDLMILINCFTA